MTRRFLRHSAFCLAALMVSGCGFMGRGSDSGPRLSELPEATLPATDTPVPTENLDLIETRYQKAFDVAQDPALRRHIQLRLADLAMTRSEREQQDSEGMGPFFDRPIALYQELLDSDEDLPGPQPDQLYYKLAKAYALDGRMEEADVALAQLARRYPDSPYFAETQFRRAQSAFSRGDYDAAESHYQGALATRSEAFSQNALYMRGWAQFKRAEYTGALDSFSQVLDQLLSGATTPDAVETSVDQLPSGPRQILDDSLRAMALSFAYLDGATSIQDLEGDIGPRPYEHLLYRQLGDIYREQERYRDSAETYAQFVVQNPDSNLAPGFSVREIDIYREGRFPSQVLPAKEAFVTRYGLHNDFWHRRAGKLDAAVLEYLHQYLVELAQFQHARAQRLSGDGSEPEQRRQAYRDAANWYREFVATFPRDPEVAEMRFLLAESLNEAGELAEALDAYETVAYQDRDPQRGTEAGYAAVLLSRQLMEQPPGSEADLDFWRERTIDNALRFAQAYPADERATAVLAYTGRQLLDLEQPERAALVAEQLLAHQPPARGDERFSAWLVLGHSRFDLQHYEAAELAYWQVLELWPQYGLEQGAPSREAVRERIAASVYQRAQLALADDNADAAVVLLLSIADIAPDTQVAISAQYDAGYHLTKLERWAEAEEVLLAFRRDYPRHELSETLPARLAEIHQAQENWAQAADELLLMEAGSDDPTLKRSSLYLAAELYERAGQPQRALENYRRYAHEYPQPLADNMEAQYKLTQLYDNAGDTERRNFWLQRLVDSHAGAGSAQSGRSTYLAAYGASELAERSFNAFIAIPLRLPLQQSLTRKRAALDLALEEQKQVLAYGVAEFATRASHRMGAIYHRLSLDLMDSERPDDLDVLALEQYDILLEEQAYPFEEKAIEIYEANARRSWDDIYDQWVEHSFESLAEILPARYGKREQPMEVSHGIH